MEMLTFGLSVSVIGMLVVFVGLIILIYCVKGISWFCTRQKQESKAEPPAAQQATDAQQAAISQDPSPDVVAAITAVIAAVWQSEQGFVVRHIKRINNAPAWNRAGREEQTYSRF